MTKPSNYIKIAPKIPPRSLLEHHIKRGLTFMELSRICDTKAAQLRAALAVYQLECPPSPQRSELRRLQLREAGYSWEQVSIICPETLKTFHTIGKLQRVRLNTGHKLELRRRVEHRTPLNVAWNRHTAEWLASYIVTTSLLSTSAYRWDRKPSHSFEYGDQEDEN